MAKHAILKDNNFVSLLEGSIETLIKIMQMILEDVKVHCKPL